MPATVIGGLLGGFVRDTDRRVGELRALLQRITDTARHARTVPMEDFRRAERLVEQGADAAAQLARQLERVARQDGVALTSEAE